MSIHFLSQRLDFSLSSVGPAAVENGFSLRSRASTDDQSAVQGGLRSPVLLPSQHAASPGFNAIERFTALHERFMQRAERQFAQLRGALELIKNGDRNSSPGISQTVDVPPVTTTMQ